MGNVAIYDCRNRLTEAGGVTYTYDAENTRSAATKDGRTTEYVTNTGGSMSQLLTAYEADGTETRYYYGAEGLAGQYNTGTKQYLGYHFDNIGSTTMVTDIAGKIVEQFAYGTYGELLTTVKNKIRFLYNGSYGVTTDENGLYYMRARYYNPDIKRFINQDIKVGDIGSSQSLNRYAYCEGNPVSLVDPFGLSPESTQDQGKTSKYEKLHNLLGTIGIFFDGADLINGFVYLAEKDYVNAAISFACGIPAVGTVVTAVAKTAKLAKYATKAAKIAKTCRDIGRIGNAAAGMKALYDTYQTAERECGTTGKKIAYIAGTVITGYLIGKAANKGAEALKKFASKTIPKLKTALRENVEKLTSRISKSFGSSGSGRMDRNRGYVINPFYKGSSKTISYADYDNIYQSSIHNAGKDKVMLGKYDGGGATSYITKAGNDYEYFSLGSNWDTIKYRYGYTDDVLFKLFNEAFLDDGINAGKTFQFLHNPINDNGALGKEYKYLINNNYKWDDKTMTMKSKY